MIGVNHGVGSTIRNAGVAVTEFVVGVVVEVIETYTFVEVEMEVVVGVIAAVGAHATRITAKTSVNNK